MEPVPSSERGTRTVAATTTEATLARAWAAQTQPGGRLRTTANLPVQIHYPGRPGRAGGPDFRDAVIQFGDAPSVVGDVELHRTPPDFDRHGHTRDTAYDRVALHVVLDAGGTTATTLASGRSVPVLELPVDEGAAPTAPLREPCATAVTRLGMPGVTQVLTEAGRWRLTRKAAGMTTRIQTTDPAQALYTALAIALGQTVNATAFGLLAERLSLAELIADDAGVEGMRAAEFARRLRHAAGLDGALVGPAPALPWVTRGLRPAAHPVRRIEALAVLVDRFGGALLAAGVTTVLQDAMVQGTKVLVEALTVAAPQGPAWCGRTRAIEVAINAVLPWALARIQGGVPAQEASYEAESIFQLAGTLPAADVYGPITHLDQNLRDSRGRSLLTTALRQQGALAFLKEWCTKGGCGRCPLS